MASADRLRELLPSLWRPEPDAPLDDLLAGLIRAGGRVIDTVSVEAGDVMQSRFFHFADSPLIAPFMGRLRAKSGLQPLLPKDPDVDLYPYLDDLPRLASLLGLAPWSEPLDARETVEDFRRRVTRMVALWKSGLGTRAALRGVTEATLPVMDRSAPDGLRERGFTVEEQSSGIVRVQQALPRGAPAGLVGPLMRWNMDSGAVLPTSPEIYIEGQASVPDQIDPTAAPVIERFDPMLGTGIGICYPATVAAGQTLALLPVVTSWVAAGSVLRSATSNPDDALPDMSASGPWSDAAGQPSMQIRCFAVAADGALWVGGNDSGSGALWRLGSAGWAEILSGLPEIGCLLIAGTDLLVGHANGVSRTPSVGAPAALTPDPVALGGPSVRALARDQAGRIWAATADGAAVLAAGDTLQPVGPGTRTESRTSMNAVLVDFDGVVYFGGASGLFLHDPSRDSWHVYHGGTADDATADWAPWDPAVDVPPTDTDVFLPEVTAVLRGTDRTLWIGTTSGIAAYRARERLRTYATLLTAYPELGGDRVFALAEDERQRLWAGTERGLFIFDGTDWRQSIGSAPARLPRSSTGTLAVTHWRFHRPTGFWQSQENGARGGFVRQTPAIVSAAEDPVRALAWTDGVVARIGTMTDDVFQADPSIVPAPPVTRIKLTATAVIDGGIPAIPRLPPGTSTWRYLAREEPAPPTPSSFPAWTREGRLLPPPLAVAAPFEGRFLTPEEAALLDSVFAYNPAARVTFRWRPRSALSVIVRLDRRTPDEAISDVVLDRVWDGIGKVRPAGCRVVLAAGSALVRGGQDG